MDFPELTDAFPASTFPESVLNLGEEVSCITHCNCLPAGQVVM